MIQIDPSSLEFTLGGEERATGVYIYIHDCRERRSQQRVKPKCEGYIKNMSDTTEKISSCKNTDFFKQTIYDEHPVYVNQLPPCNNACPAGENIQEWLSLTQSGKFQKAYEALIRNNPFPAIHGRVCYHPCEDNCNRRSFDSTINIHAIERFLGDSAIKENWEIPLQNSNTGKKVLIVGAGPAGLSAAYHLRRLGHEVTIYEALPKAGGMMYVGIPNYRLPENILDAEINRILSLGIKIEYNSRVTDVLAEKDRGYFDAVFLGIGAHKGKTVDVITENPCPILDAVKFLHAVKTKTLPKIESDIVVFGGSNSAMDVARSAIRLGIKNVTVAYHRSRARMAAFDFEVEEALEEGVNLKVLRSLNKINSDAVTLNVVELDDKGNPQPTGEKEKIKANMFVFALGQNPETDFLKNIPGINFKNNGCVLVDEQMMTGASGIFAGGDMLPFDQSVTTAVGHGKKAACAIDAYLNNTTYKKPKKHDIIYFENMDLWFHETTPKIQQSILNAEERSKSFAEVVNGFSKQNAQYEANRCFSCGNCFECDGCYGVCPEKAITKLGAGKRYCFDRDLCTGCGACARECPCSAIVMKPDEEKE